MHEFEKFGTIPRGDIKAAVSLSESFLPVEYEPELAADDTLLQVRSFEGHLETRDAAVHTHVRRVRTADGNDCLSATKLSERYDNGAVTSTVYSLMLDNGRFLVQRSTDNSKDIMPVEQRNLSAYEQAQADVLEFDLGLMSPDYTDWDDFMSLLARPTDTPERQSTTKGNRVARLLGWLRKRQSQSYDE